MQTPHPFLNDGSVRVILRTVMKRPENGTLWTGKRHGFFRLLDTASDAIDIGTNQGPGVSGRTSRT